jgi:response regulator RpfG family c-di-GMP phosphodiesterase
MAQANLCSRIAERKSMAKVLVVDDEENIRLTFGEFIRNAGHEAYTAKDGEEALQIIERESPFALVVSDMSMPNMNGIELLTKIKEVSPDTVRMILTGYADLEVSIDAINQGNVFRFLTKPCPGTAFMDSINAGLEQHRLILAEKELLEDTLNGSIAMLTDALSMADPEIFGFAMTLKKGAGQLAMALEKQNSWQIEIAAMLSQIGYLTLPNEVRKKARRGQKLSETERQMVEKAPEIGCNLVSHIPRLEQTANIILYQKKSYDGSGPPYNDVAGQEIPLGARILKVLVDFAEALLGSNSYKVAVARLGDRKGVYDADVLQTAIKIKVFSDLLEDSKQPRDVILVQVGDLQVGDMLATDLLSVDGRLLLKKGSDISQMTIERIQNYARLSYIQDSIRVWR